MRKFKIKEYLFFKYFIIIMNITIDYLHKGTFTKMYLVSNLLAFIFNTSILISMILMKSIDSYTNILIVLKLIMDTICSLSFLMENIIITWFNKLNSVNKDILSWIINYGYNYLWIFMLLLIYHRFRLLNIPLMKMKIFV